MPFETALGTALRPDAPKVRGSGNIAGKPKVYERGDVEAGPREAEVVIEQEYTTPVALHHCLKPHGSVATWEGEDLTQK